MEKKYKTDFCKGMDEEIDRKKKSPLLEWPASIIIAVLVAVIVRGSPY